MPSWLYDAGISPITDPLIIRGMYASGSYPAAVAGSNELVTAHLFSVESYANNLPLPSAACSITIPPSVAPAEPEANKIYLSFTVKFVAFVNDAVPATDKFPDNVKLLPVALVAKAAAVAAFVAFATAPSTFAPAT